MRKRIEVTKDIREMIRGTYEEATIYEVNVHKITVDENEVDIEVDVCVNGAWTVCSGNIQIGLDDDNSLAKAIREVIT